MLAPPELELVLEPLELPLPLDEEPEPELPLLPLLELPAPELVALDPAMPAILLALAFWLWMDAIIALWEAVTAVLLTLSALVFAAGVTRAAPEVVALAVAEAMAGTSSVLMSLGRATNQLGVWPAANSEAISLDTAAELVRASATREEGRAVWRTE